MILPNTNIFLLIPGGILTASGGISGVTVGFLIGIGIVAVVLLVKWIFRTKFYKKEPEETINTSKEEPKKNINTTKEEPQKTINVKSEPMNTENKYDGLNTTELVKAILKDSNCTYDESEDKMDLIFSYQGETFLARIPEADNPRIRLFDVNWYNCPLDNLEEMSCMQKAINAANIGQMSTAVYIIDKEQKCMTVYSKADFFIWNNIPQPDNYFRMWLNSMFYLKQDIVVEFEKEKQKIGLND